jgi:hypothetical protein
VWRDERHRLIHLIDWMAKPEAPGAGITLLKGVSQLADGMLIAGGSSMTRKILPALGFRDCGSALRLVLPIRPLACFRHDTRGSWKAWARLGQNLAWRLASDVRDTGTGLTAVPATSEEIAQSTFPPARSPGDGEPALVEMSAPGLSHLLRCPVTTVQFYWAERHGVRVGYFVLAQALGQCRIVDARIDAQDQKEWQSLYRLAVRTAIADRQTVEISTIAGGIDSEALRAIGFRVRGETPLRWRIPGTQPPAEVRFRMAAYDGAVLHGGRRSFAL